MAQSKDIERVLEELPWGAEITLVLKDKTELTGIYEGLRADQILLADGTETTFPDEIPVGRVANVLLHFETKGPE